MSMELKNMDNTLSYAQLEEFLESKGIKPTANRILVIRELLKASRPISMTDLESIFDHTVDKTSIFRVLELFAQKEIVHVIEDGSRSLKYELCRSHPCHTISDQHAHFFCERCKEIFCLPDIRMPIVELPEGYQPHAINYVIKGLCPGCS